MYLVGCLSVAGKIYSLFGIKTKSFHRLKGFLIGNLMHLMNCRKALSIPKCHHIRTVFLQRIQDKVPHTGFLMPGLICQAFPFFHY